MGIRTFQTRKDSSTGASACQAWRKSARAALKTKIIVLFSRRFAADLLLSASSTDTNNDTMNLAVCKQIADKITVVATGNEVQVRVGIRVEYVWFCNSIQEARGRWLQAVDAAKRLNERMAACA